MVMGADRTTLDLLPRRMRRAPRSFAVLLGEPHYPVSASDKYSPLGDADIFLD
jgi:hypothetical protein